ncbi:MAG: DUF3943 domain-containing protein [Gemmatimonadales bacterium]
MSHCTRALIIALALAPVGILPAQDTTTTAADTSRSAPDSTRCGFCHHPNVPVAIFEGILVNGMINRFNAWVRNDSTARVTPSTWKHNLDRGFDWDTDDFVVNMLLHPYGGSQYFQAARSNGLSYWASAPLVFLGSTEWEYFGETTRPSINDLVNTGMGGIALGEMFYRVAATIRSNEASGGERFLRELAALPFDPVGSVNRLFRGEWSRQGPDPSEHNPGTMVLRLGAGAGVVRAPSSLQEALKDATSSTIGFADFKYGDAFIDPMRKPFDAFSMRILLAPGHGDLTQLTGTGRITGAELGRGENFRNQIEFNQRFEYFNNGAFRFGGQTLELGLASRLNIAGNVWLRTEIAGDGIALAGIDAPGAGVGPRTYDFGPGVGATITASLDHGAESYLTARFQPAYVHTLSGAHADHYTTFASIEANIPVLDQLDLVAEGTYYDRVSHYADGASNHRAFPEIWAFVTFKAATRATAVRSER